MLEIGPNFGYYPKPSKTWLIVKPKYLLKRAKDLFPSIDISIWGLTVVVIVAKLS